MAILSKLSIIATHVAQSSLETYNESVFLETRDEVLDSVAALQPIKSQNKRTKINQINNSNQSSPSASTSGGSPSIINGDLEKDGAGGDKSGGDYKAKELRLAQLGRDREAVILDSKKGELETYGRKKPKPNVNQIKPQSASGNANGLGAKAEAKRDSERSATRKLFKKNTLDVTLELERMRQADGDAVSREKIVHGERHLIFRLLSSAEIREEMSEPTRSTWQEISKQEGGCHVTRYINHIDTGSGSAEDIALRLNDAFLLSLVARRVYASVAALLDLLDEKSEWQDEKQLREFLVEKKENFPSELYGEEACVIMLHELPGSYMTLRLWIKTDSLWTSFLRDARSPNVTFPWRQWLETSSIEDTLFPGADKTLERFLHPKPPASVGFWKGLSDLFMIFAGLEINSAEMKEITADMKTHNMWLSSTILFGRCLTVIYSVVNSNKNIELAYEQLAKEAVKLLYSCYAGLKSEEFETEIKASYSTLAAGTLLTHLPSWVIAAVLSGVSIRKNGPTPYYKIRGSVPFTNLAYGLGLTMVGYQCSQAVSFQYGYDFGGICDKNEHCNLWVHTVSLTFFFVALIFFFGLIIAFPSYCSKK